MASVGLTEADYFEVLDEIRYAVESPLIALNCAAADDLARVTALALRSLETLSLSLQMELIEVRELLEERIMLPDSHCQSHSFTILNQLYSPFVDRPIPPLHEFARPREVGELTADFVYRIVGDYLLPDLEGDTLAYRLLSVILTKVRPKLGPLFERLLPDELPGYHEQRGSLLEVFDALSRFAEDYQEGRIRDVPLSSQQESAILYRQLVARSDRFEDEEEVVQILHEVLSLLLEPEALFGIFHRLISDDFWLGDDEEFAEGCDDEFIEELSVSLRRLVDNALQVSRPGRLISGAYQVADRLGLLIGKEIALLVDGFLRGFLESGSIPRKLELATVLLWANDGRRAIMEEPVDHAALERQFEVRAKQFVDFLGQRSVLLGHSKWIRGLVEKRIIALFFVLREIVADRNLVSRLFYQYLLPVL